VLGAMQHTVPTTPRQVAYLVPDVGRAARAWAARAGAGPFLVREHPPLSGRSAAGQPVVLEHASAYGQWGPVVLELVSLSPGTSPALRVVLDGPPGLHHVAWFTEDLRREQRRLTELGWPAVLTACTAGGVPFAFHDARADLGHLVRVYEPVEQVLALHGRVRRVSLGWDGANPVRPLEDEGLPAWPQLSTVRARA
jgi:hypothetical protein